VKPNSDVGPFASALARELAGPEPTLPGQITIARERRLEKSGEAGRKTRGSVSEGREAVAATAGET
jgi:hypothetical protein